MFRAHDLPLLVVFAKVAGHGSFTAAARELGLAKSVVSDHVRALERRCGMRLIERTSRRLRLTQVGERLLQTAASVVAAAASVEAILGEHRNEVAGTLRVATTSDLGPRLVIPVAAGLGSTHPKLRIDVVSDDSVHDLVDGGFDVAIRLGIPRNSGHVIRKLGVMREIIVAAPALAKTWPTSRPRDLAGAPWARHSLLRRPHVLTFRDLHGDEEQAAVVVRAQANTGEGLRALVLAGVGFATLPEYLVADDVLHGDLIHICPAWYWKDIMLFAELPSVASRLPRVSMFLAALGEAAGRAPIRAAATAHRRQR